MSSDELKSEEKRAQDAALEKENMNKAMTAQEEKAISTTYAIPMRRLRAYHLRPCSLCRIRGGECRVCFALEIRMLTKRNIA